MKNTFTIFAAALSVMAAGSCDSTVTPGEPDLTAREIVLSTSITAAGVKAAYPQTNTQLIAGETVNVYTHEVAEREGRGGAAPRVIARAENVEILPEGRVFVHC